MHAIGGYFELELPGSESQPYHQTIALNSGRNALKFILKNRTIGHIYVPYYTCEAVIEPIKELNIPYTFYQLNELLEIADLNVLNTDQHVLYINYFGLKGRYIETLKNNISNLIVDNSQAFFDLPLPNTDTFYSPRKFFGVPGGGYVYGLETESSFTSDTSYDRSKHLLIRLEQGPELGYDIYQENEAKFKGRPIKQMSIVTKKILDSIDYRKLKARRNKNFLFLHEYLKDLNEISNLISNDEYPGPLIYPFLNKKINRDELIEQRIYVPHYWPGIVRRLSDQNCFEYNMSTRLLAFPIDHRYGKPEMERIIDLITNYAK